MTIEEMLRKLESNPRIHKFTETENALGKGLGMRSYSSDGTIRWLDDGAIIEFTNPNYIGRNVEFEINNNPNHKIWLSQLQYVFINDKNRDEIFSGRIKLKNGTEKFMLTFSSHDFYEFVKGRKFKVSLDENAIYQIDIKDERVKSILETNHLNYSKVVDYIFEKLDSEEYNLIKGMTKLGRCYDLEEV